MGLFDFLSKVISKNTKPPSNYVVFDIETTGFSRTNDRIIEIAADKYANGKLVDQFHSYVNPGYPIPVFITQLTGITNRNVAHAPTIHEIKKSVLAFFGKNALVGHNITTFDIPFLNHPDKPRPKRPHHCPAKKHAAAIQVC